MIKVIAITVGNAETASTKYRVGQYTLFFKKQGIVLECIPQQELSAASFERLSKADLIINQKCLLSSAFAKKLFKLGPPVVFDFDDSIYTRPGRPYGWLTQMRVMHRFRLWMRRSHCVVTANYHLREFAERYTTRTEVIPMALDCEVWRLAEKRENGAIRIGWVGSPSNLHHLERIGEPLKKVFERYPKASLAVYSGGRPNLPCPYDYTPFSGGGDLAFVQSLDIGLLPLTDEEYSRGKSPFKAIQYMACGIPVIGNVFGATGEILTLENSLRVDSEADWQVALSRLIEERALRQQLGLQGRKKVERDHSLQRCQEKWVKLIKEVCNNKVAA